MECNISKAREHHRMTQAELAEKAEISRITLSKIENGRMMPSLEIAMRISDAIGERIQILWTR
ncbi:MAG: helix-turn-helix transcriptional regulator [Bdellovibrionaceae bacterium]|nr:helix-turn-helix transcriptional regulator [Pseudobdellovibrionaceae bacterium]